LKSFDAAEKLRELGLTTSPEVVREAVQRIKNGESLYGLYMGEIRLMAKATAVKVKNLLDAGKLDFLLDMGAELEEVTAATEEVTAATEEVKALMEAADPEHPPMMSRKDLSRLAREQFNDNVRWRLSELPDNEWDIECLESIGIPLQKALNLLIEKGHLFQRVGEWLGPDLKRYMAIYRIVLLCQQQETKVHKAPYPYIELAAEAWANGEIDGNSLLQTTSLNILRFQAWRGSDFFEAFQRAQVATNRAARRSKEQYEKNIAALIEMGQISG